MKINIKSKNLEITPAIQEYIEVKIGSIEHFLKKFETKSEIEVFIEITRTTRHHKSGKVFYAEANFRLPNKIIRAEHSDWDIRVAVDKVKDKLQQEIKKYKDTHRY